MRIAPCHLLDVYAITAAGLTPREYQPLSVMRPCSAKLVCHEVATREQLRLTSADRQHNQLRKRREFHGQHPTRIRRQCENQSFSQAHDGRTVCFSNAGGIVQSVRFRPVFERNQLAVIRDVRSPRAVEPGKVAFAFLTLEERTDAITARAAGNERAAVGYDVQHPHFARNRQDRAFLTV